MPEPRSLEEWADYLASVGDNQGLDETIPSLYEAGKEALCAYAAQVRQEEREACAKIAEDYQDVYDWTQRPHGKWGIAAAIRARES